MTQSGINNESKLPEVPVVKKMKPRTKNTLKRKSQTKLSEEFTQFQEEFITEYLKNGGNGTQAYLLLRPDANIITARNRACDLLNKPTVIEEISALRGQLITNKKVELQYVIDKLVTIIEETMMEETERDENGKIVSKPDRKSTLAALAQLSKIMGYDKLNINIDSQITKRIIKVNIKRDE